MTTSSPRLPVGLASYQTFSSRRRRRRERLITGLAIAGLVFSAAVAQQLIHPGAPQTASSAYAYFNH